MITSELGLSARLAGFKFAIAPKTLRTWGRHGAALSGGSEAGNDTGRRKKAGEAWG